MNHAACAFFTFLLIISICFISGCSAPSGSKSAPVATSANIDKGFSINEIPAAPTNISFDEVVADLADLDFVSDGGASSDFARAKHIQLVRGSMLDIAGNASRWMFTVRHVNETLLVTYGPLSRTITEWPGSYPDEEIFLDQILTPRDLVSKYRERIFTDSFREKNIPVELVIVSGQYILTSQVQGIQRVMVFNATTGEMIPDS